MTSKIKGFNILSYFSILKGMFSFILDPSVDENIRTGIVLKKKGDHPAAEGFFSKYREDVNKFRDGFNAADAATVTDSLHTIWLNFIQAYASSDEKLASKLLVGILRENRISGHIPTICAASAAAYSILDEVKDDTNKDVILNIQARAKDAAAILGMAEKVREFMDGCGCLLNTPASKKGRKASGEEKESSRITKTDLTDAFKGMFKGI